MGVCLNFIELSVCDVSGAPRFLEAFNPLAWDLEDRVAPSRALLKLRESRAFSRFESTLGCLAANVQVFLHLHGRDGYPDPMTSYTQIGGKHMGDKRVEIKTESF